MPGSELYPGIIPTFNCHRPKRPASCVAALPPTTDATVVTRRSLSTAIDRLPPCLERRPPPPRSSASLPSFFARTLGNYGGGKGLVVWNTSNRGTILNQILLALVNHLGKGLRDGHGPGPWTRSGPGQWLQRGNSMETLAGAPRYPRVWAKQASPWGSTVKGDSRLDSVSTSAAESNNWSTGGVCARGQSEGDWDGICRPL